MLLCVEIAVALSQLVDFVSDFEVVRSVGIEAEVVGFVAYGSARVAVAAVRKVAVAVVVVEDVGLVRDVGDENVSHAEKLVAWIDDAA